MPDEIDVLRTFRDETPGPTTDAWLRARSAIAAASAEEEPAKASPRFHWRPARAQLIAAAAAVVIGAGLLVANALESAGPQQVQAMAYLTRVEQALNGSGQAKLVGYARTQFTGSAYAAAFPGGIEILAQRGSTSDASLVGVGSIVRWNYQMTLHISALTPAGKEAFGETIATPGGVPATKVVNYSDSTWWQATGATAGSRSVASAGCSSGVALSAGAWPQFIRQQLSCGAYTLAGRQWVDGIDAVKITGDGHAGLSELWVNPKTYLPVRAMSATLQTDFSWLPPTPQNLAQLGLAVPAGFRQVEPPAPPDSR